MKTIRLCIDGKYVYAEAESQYTPWNIILKVANVSKPENINHEKHMHSQDLKLKNEYHLAIASIDRETQTSVRIDIGKCELEYILNTDEDVIKYIFTQIKNK